MSRYPRNHGPPPPGLGDDLGGADERLRGDHPEGGSAAAPRAGRGPKMDPPWGLEVQRVEGWMKVGGNGGVFTNCQVL